MLAQPSMEEAESTIEEIRYNKSPSSHNTEIEIIKCGGKILKEEDWKVMERGDGTRRKGHRYDLPYTQ
jgi:hypothetical protein